MAEGWAEPYLTPQDVPDWRERQARAYLPYRIDENGFPRNPAGRTGRRGRNLGNWAENKADDLAVFTGAGDDKQVLLIRRTDRRQWAIAGGMEEPWELVKALEADGGLYLPHRPLLQIAFASLG